MPDFKFAKGFFTGMLVTDAIIATGLLVLTWQTLKPKEDYNRPLGRYDSYSDYVSIGRNKEFLQRSKKCI